MSFGKPGPLGKFYYGRSDDPPVNHDILWRGQLEAEKKNIDKVERLRADWARRYSATLGGLRWTNEAISELKRAVKKHGERGWHNILTDPVFEKLQEHTKDEIIQKWTELRNVKPELGNNRSTSPIKDPKELREAFGRTNPKLVSTFESERNQIMKMKKQLARERAARESAEMRAKAELLETKAMRQRLQKYEKLLSQVKDRRRQNSSNQLNV